MNTTSQSPNFKMIPLLPIIKKDSNIRSLWMGFQTVSGGNLPNFSILLEDLYDHYQEEMDVNSRVFLQLTHGEFQMNQEELTEAKFDINKIPWRFLSLDTLALILERAEQPIFINLENDLYLAPELIQFAIENRVFWKNLRAEGEASDIPNYVNLMLSVAYGSISNNDYEDAVVWTVLTDCISRDQRIRQTILYFFRRIIVPFSEPIPLPGLITIIDVLYAGMVPD